MISISVFDAATDISPTMVIRFFFYHHTGEQNRARLPNREGTDLSRAFFVRLTLIGEECRRSPLFASDAKRRLSGTAPGARRWYRQRASSAGLPQEWFCLFAR